jgi:manganese oxidase
MNKRLNRRSFLKVLGVGAGAASATALSKTLSDTPTAFASTVTPLGNAHPQQVDWEEMDRMHEEGVKKFLANIGKEENFFRKPLEFTMDGDVKVFEITASNIEWQPSVDMAAFPAMAYNEMVPGPEIRITQGDKVRIILNNKLDQSTAIHFHGVDVPNEVDGVPFITQSVVKPGETFTYEFVAENSGSHMYHSHHNAAEQVVGGLLGALIIEPADKSSEPEFTKDYTIVLNDSMLGFTLNGRSFPYTQPVVAKLGETIRVRYMNEGLMIHPMHLHGMPQQIIAKDGYALSQPYYCDTLNIAPGERYDVLIKARAAGVWAFHCHILTHAESRQGMFGMVTVLLVEE